VEEAFKRSKGVPDASGLNPCQGSGIRITQLNAQPGKSSRTERQREGSVDQQLIDLGVLVASHAEAIRLVEGGKRVGDAVYMHEALLAQQPADIQDLVAAASQLAALTHDAFNVIRFSTRRPEIAFLCYPAFFMEPFPVLRASWLVRLSTGQIAHSDFSMQDNPPILHRKELLLPAAHPARIQSEHLTAILDDFQAFDFAPHLIGRRDHWSETLASVGIRIDGDQVVRVTEAATNGRRASVPVARHRTAISRSRLSAPMQSLARWGFLDTSLTVLDYGCGRGDDVSALAAAGIDVTGWDPHFAPEARLIESDIVNLGYVLNVIESPSERAEALLAAYRLTRRVLSIAVMLSGNGTGSGHADGILTKRQTFQRYYTQSELREYVAQVLGRDAVAVAPGIVFVFRSDDDEQGFLARKQRSAAVPVVGFDVPIAYQAHTTRPSLYERHQLLLDRFWATVLELGRLPVSDELEQAQELLAAAGSIHRAFASLPFAEKESDLARVAARRKDDLLVYLALNIFERRQSFGSIPASVQRDVKAFFGSYKSALEHGRRALFEAGDAERTRTAVAAASQTNLGALDAEDGDYTFHASSVTQQPVALRIILGCAERIEPLPPEIDLVKVHGSGQKVSYLSFDKFSERAMPPLARRTIIDLGTQRTTIVLSRGADGPRVLLGKSHFLPENAPGRERQERFDDLLQRSGIFKVAGLGPGYRILARQLAEAGLVPSRADHDQHKAVDRIRTDDG
jgi:DNA phosphorothioation-associated putative methyltransferase